MPPDPPPPLASEVSQELPGTQTRTGQPAAAPARRWRRRVADVAGLTATFLLVLFIWHEFDARALVEADAAYRRNDLETTLRIARGHLARWPFSRYATSLAARCLSRLGRPDEAEAYYEAPVLSVSKTGTSVPTPWS